MPTMLPSVPKSLGRLGDVLVSAQLAVSGSQNALSLKAVDSAIVLLVDGLGWHNLRLAGGHARFLNGVAQLSKPINSVFPSTTAAALTTLATGVQPNEHGIIGYRVFDRQTRSAHNLLSGWTSFEQSEGWRKVPNLSQSKADTSVLHFVGPAAYARSGFTNIIMTEAVYHGADALEARFETALNLSRTKGALIYLYVPELDQTAHAQGVESHKWLSRLEELDSHIAKLAAGLSNKVGLIVTADHGIVDVPQHQHIHLDKLNLQGVSYVGGDTRCAYVYLDDPTGASAMAEEITRVCAGDVAAFTFAEAVESGWLGEVDADTANIAPDLIVAANRRVAIYHRDFSSPKSYSMVGHHGSWTAEELQVPALRFGAWA